MKKLQIDQAETCSISGCRSDIAYGICDDTKIYRITFSYDLARLICERHGNGKLKVCKIKFRIGRKLQPGETSYNGIYGLIKTKNDWALRISLIKDCANLYCDWDTSYLSEIHIDKITDIK